MRFWRQYVENRAVLNKAIKHHSCVSRGDLMGWTSNSSARRSVIFYRDFITALHITTLTCVRTSFNWHLTSCFVTVNLWQRIGALEEMLRNVNCTASPDTETVTQDIAKYVNETPEFRVPHPVPSSEECDLSQQSSARYSGRNESLSKSLPSIDSSCVLHDKVTAIAACKTVSSGCQTAGNPKRRKFNGD